MHRADTVAIELARRQSGAFAGWQLDRHEIPRWIVTRRLRTGAWLRALPGVYLLPGAPAGYQQRLWTAWLAAGPQSVVSHQSAAELHGIPDVVRGQLTLTGPHSGWHRLPAITVHQINDVLPGHVVDIGGLPVTSVPRTIVDLSAVVRPARLRSIVEDTNHARLAGYVAIGECMQAIARRGKPGVRQLARTLDLLTKTGGITHSRLERIMVEVLVRYQVERPILQFPHPGRQFVRSCTDASYPDAKLIYEIDGRTWHSRIKDLKLDRERDLAAALAGWQTMRFLCEHVLADPEQTARAVAIVLAERRALLANGSFSTQ